MVLLLIPQNNVENVTFEFSMTHTRNECVWMVSKHSNSLYANDMIHNQILLNWKYLLMWAYKYTFWTLSFYHHVMSTKSVFLAQSNGPGSRPSDLQSELSLSHIREKFMVSLCVNIRFLFLWACLFSFPRSAVFQTFVIFPFMQFELMWVIVVVRGFSLPVSNYPIYSFHAKLSATEIGKLRLLKRNLGIIDYI